MVLSYMLNQSAQQPDHLNQMSEPQELPQLIISLRGKKYGDFNWTRITLVSDVKSYLSTCVVDELDMEPSDVKLLHKGKILSDDSMNLHSILIDPTKKKILSKKPIRLMAMGVSSKEAKRNEDEFNNAKSNAPRIRDDLSQAGRAEIAARQRLGRKMLHKASHKDSINNSTQFGFGRIETLPMLPQQNEAKNMLNSLANDPGVLSCMAKHKWNVGCLAELFPEGKVGESAVCVMGLNQNKGQKILLRLRTDDLKGFRKMLSIRKVLFHELAHNVHSEHDGEFYKLMRQIEKECNDSDWTKHGNRSGGASGASDMYSDLENVSFFGGTYKLSSNDPSAESKGLSKRELAGRAAMMRLSDEEKQIQEACGCFRDQPVHSESRTTVGTNGDDEMDLTE